MFDSLSYMEYSEHIFQDRFELDDHIHILFDQYSIVMDSVFPPCCELHVKVAYGHYILSGDSFFADV